MTSSKQLDDAILMFQAAEFSKACQTFKQLLAEPTDGENKQDNLFNLASCLASLGDFDEALKTLNRCNIGSNYLKFNLALCYYKKFDYEESLNILDEIIVDYQEKCTELSIGRSNIYPSEDNNEFNESGLSDRIYHDTCIIEAINLKSAILFEMSENKLDAKKCLDSLPVKRIDQFDCVSLHNKAIYDSYDHKICLESSISKLSYLSDLVSNTDNTKQTSLFYPLTAKEVFYNQLKLYILNDMSENALDYLRHFKSQLENSITNYELKFVEIILEKQVVSSDELVCFKLSRLLDQLIEEAKKGQINLEKLALDVSKYEATILWNNNQYKLLEKLLLKVEPLFHKEHNLLWQTYLGHALYMQDTRFEECLNIYESFLPDESSGEDFSLMVVDPAKLGNLCVSYVLTGRNSNAETLIKNVEGDEVYSNDVTEDTADLLVGKSDFISLYESNEEEKFTNKKRNSHSSIINYNISTLYCVKYNYEFGLARIFKTLEPLEVELNMQSWFVAKRCILSLIDNHCKQLICVEDDLFNKVIEFLIECEKHGTLIDTKEPTILIQTVGSDKGKSFERELLLKDMHGKNSVTYEARYLRSIILTVVHD